MKYGRCWPRNYRELTFSEKNARNFLNKLDIHIATRIYEKIESIRENPYRFVKGLTAMGDLKKLRIGEYRVILEIIDEEILIIVVDIGHRRNIYK